MKFTYLATGLLAALLTSAQPVLDEEKYSVDYASGNVTGEVSPQLATGHLTERALAKRANSQFIMYTSSGKFLLNICSQRPWNADHALWFQTARVTDS